MQKKKGITITILVITVIVIAILTTTIVISAKKVSENNKLRTFVAELNMIKDEIVLRQNNGETEDYIVNTISMELSGVNANIIDTQFKGEEIIDDTITVYTIDISALGFNNSNYGKQKTEKDIFAYSNTTGKLYYIEGIKVNDTTYYTLTEDLEIMVGSKYNIEKQNSQVIFKPSEIGWTSNAIKTEVIIPLEFTNIEITTTLDGTDNVSNIEEQDGKYVAIVNVLEKKANYNIEVTYVKNGESITESFDIKNYDGNSPNVTIGEQTYKISEYNLQSYIQNIVATDNESGIKQIKYEKDKISEISAKDYFSKNGKVLKDTKILIDNQAIYYTIYVEDKAGNIGVYNVKISDDILNARIIKGFNIAKGVCEPFILEGMTPVVYDPTSSTGDYWRDATEEEIKTSSWYNYESTDKRWANARSVDGSLWVWIPRFEYDILEEPNTVAKENTGTINVRFIPKTVTKGAKGYTVDSEGIIRSNDGYIVHPAFVDETDITFYNGGWSKEIGGIWVAKFEMSMEENGVNVNTSALTKGNVASSATKKVVSKATNRQWRYINAANAYYNSLNYTSYVAGLSSNYASHMIKNSEWGAMVYLSHSKYGYGIQNIARNSDTTYHSGGSADISVVYGENRNLSTTGNVYGIYDACGGVFERPAIFNTDYSGSADYYGDATYTTSDGLHFGSVGGASTRYATAYKPSTNAMPSKTNSRTGDAIYELATTGVYVWASTVCQSMAAATTLVNRGGAASVTAATIIDQKTQPGNAIATGGYRVVLAEN